MQNTRPASDALHQDSLLQDHDIALDLPGEAGQRPANVTHLSFPSYESPLRHHKRQISAPRQVKETLHAQSSYTNSEDDGGAVHRINQYVIKQEIGRGSFGAVHLAVDQNDCEYAVKEFSKSRLRKRAQSHVLRRPPGVRPRPGHQPAGVGFNSPLHRRDPSDAQHDDETSRNPLYLIREEIAIMKKLNHHNLVGLLEVLDDPTEDSLYMVLEMCKKGVVMKLGIGERADPYDPESCRCWFRDLILGIEYLHAQGIVHRDIKPDNLLLTEDDVLKIVDFGVSEMFEKESDMTTAKSAGSPAFLPPELCMAKHGKISGKAADIWSMGVTLYCLYFGRVPFEKTSVLDLYDSIKDDAFVLPDDCDPNFADLLHRVLEKDPQRRIQMPELREHPWVTGNGADPLLPFEENTANLAEPPTEEEMKQAITGNLSNLILVMKAARRFKGLLTKTRPYIMDSILGQSSRMVQPPQAMNSPSSRKPSRDMLPRVVPPSLHHRPHSDGTQDRRPIEQALAREGVHRAIDPDIMDSPVPMTPTTNFPAPFAFAHKPSGPKPSADPPHSYTRRDPLPKSTRADSGKALPEDHHGRGHAHNPLDDFLYLSIGPGARDDPSSDPSSDPSAADANDEFPTVSESPPASELNIYETAYHQEVERIRTNSRSATLYLTRRVREPEKYEDDAHIIQGEPVEQPPGHHHQQSVLERLVDKARSKGKATAWGRGSDKAADQEERTEDGMGKDGE